MSITDINPAGARANYNSGAVAKRGSNLPNSNQNPTGPGVNYNFHPGLHTSAHSNEDMNPAGAGTKYNSAAGANPNVAGADPPLAGAPAFSPAPQFFVLGH